MNFEEISLNFTIFSVLFGITFAYFVFFFHQAAENESTISSKVVEMNAINRPFPLQFLTISGHKEYYYLRRKEVLLNEFNHLNDVIQKSADKSTLRVCGIEMQRCITQIAYFFPYKKFLDFKKDGTVVFDPNNNNSIENNIHIEFLKRQLDEILDLNYRFTSPLKDGKEKIINALILAGGFTDLHTKERVGKYINSLIEYLENHHKFALPLGLTIKKYEFLNQKVVRWKIIVISCILLICFLGGIITPIFFNIGKWSTILTVVLFFCGVSFLFYDAIISKSPPSSKAQPIESEYKNKEKIAMSLPENDEELPWDEYNVHVGSHLPACIAEKVRPLGVRCEVMNFGGVPKFIGVSLTHSVELKKFQKILLILQECSVVPDFITYDKHDVQASVLLGRTITIGGFQYKHGPVKKVDSTLLSKLLAPRTTQKEIEQILTPDSNLVQN